MQAIFVTAYAMRNEDPIPFKCHPNNFTTHRSDRHVRIYDK